MSKVAGKSNVGTDWHQADVKAELAKKGYSFARIAREYGYSDRSPNAVLSRPWSHMEKIVAGIIGVMPQEVWPTRYDKRGKPLKSRTARVTPKRTIPKQRTVSNG